EPMLMIIAEGAALAILRPRRILRDDVEGQLRDGRQSLAGVFLHIPEPVLLLQGLDLLRQCLNLREEQRVGEDRPSMNDQGRRLASDHSSSADRAASRSTSTPPIRDCRRWT